MAEFVGALDQGTTSTRFIVFDRDGNQVGSSQMEHRQILPLAGWVEHDAGEIWRNSVAVISSTLQKLAIGPSSLAAIGVTNQRETTVVWDPVTGQPLANAIVWQDTRTASMMAEIDRSASGSIIRAKTGLVPAPYFSAGKMRWLLDHVEGLRQAGEAGRALFGTVDSWLLWNLTGGVDGGVHITDVTNAGRTMLMDLQTLEWDDELLQIFAVPRSMLGSIRPSSDPEFYGTAGAASGAEGVPVAAALGDQHAALLGQTCTETGETKNTYGTGNFLVFNTGSTPVQSRHGLLTTMGYQLGGDTPVYALEGSVAVTGSAVQWLRDQMGLIETAADSEALASQVPDSGGMYFVPAFSGLFAPHWRSDARGAIVGMSRYNTKAHLARATLEAICFQSREVVEAMQQDAGVHLSELRVDGGVSMNDLCMQIQADVLGVPIRRPVISETTALGAAYAAGLAVGFWSSVDELRRKWQEDRAWEPQWSADERDARYAKWKKAVQRTLDWEEARPS